MAIIGAGNPDFAFLAFVLPASPVPAAALTFVNG